MSKRKLAAITVMVLGIAAVWYWATTGSDHAELARRARLLMARGDYEAASNTFESALAATPDNESQLKAELLLDHGKCLLKLKEWDSAANQFKMVDGDEEVTAEAKFELAKLSRDHSYDLMESEAYLRSCLDIFPGHNQARDQLIRLLASSGRRFEAIPHVKQLIARGTVTDHVFLLARSSAVITDSDLHESVLAHSNSDPVALMGISVIAEQQGRTDDALRPCKAAASGRFTPAIVRYGHLLLSEQNFDEVERWAATLPAEARTFAQAHRVLGYLAEHKDDRETAWNNLLKAVQLDPTLKDVWYTMSQWAHAAEQPDIAQQCQNNLEALNVADELLDRVLLQPSQTSAEDYRKLALHLRASGRVWEAAGWSRHALNRFPNDHQLQELAAAQLPTETPPTSSVLSADANPAVRFARWSSSFAQPDSTITSSARHRDSVVDEYAYVDTAREAGLEFRHVNGPGRDEDLRMYHTTGGGVGVVDFDNDFYPDVAFSQAGNVLQNNPQQDELFRNHRGEGFQSTAGVSGFGGHGFGQGITSGDCNNDGFADIIVAEFGQVQIWWNNGDGTFHPETIETGSWTTSAAVADFNDDGFSDLFLVHYLNLKESQQKICRDENGTVRICSPSIMEAAQDSLLLNSGDGDFVDKTTEMLAGASAGKGLGVLVWSNDATANVVFVANDTTANNLWSPDGANSYTDTAFAAGVAANHRGKNEGCMGISLGDVDHDGNSEIFVTNFLAESNTLYQGVTPGLWQDRTNEFNLSENSLDRLGFGTQMLDVDLNGSLEIFVTNGHIDDLSDQGRPYRMVSQLFYFDGQQFQHSQSDRLESIFQQKVLGRATARIDWNRDHRPDLVVGLLNDDAVLLTNQTDSIAKGVSVLLVGHENRDSVGAVVSLTLSNGDTIRRYQTSGDGYQCCNQKDRMFGCGQSELSRLQVAWPGDKTLTVPDVLADAHYIANEKHEKLYLIPL